MRIQFCGADRTVTGSCHLLEINGLRFLLDVGLYQGARDVANRLNRWLPENATHVDAVVLSHGHLDHCGKLPVLVKAGYAGPIYTTPATAEVARIVLMDAAQIQEEDATYLNNRSRSPSDPKVEPLYRRGDALAVLKLFKRVPYGQKVDLGKGVSFTYFDAGHILGSAYVVVEWTEGGRDRSLLFTADVGRYDTPILRDPHPLERPVDTVITESTYGDRTHAPMAQVGPELLETVKGAIARGGRLLVPSFAVGRTQTMLWYMQKFITEGSIPPIPVYVDSPMGVEVSKVHSEFRENYDDETRKLIGEKDLFGLSHARFASSSAESKAINAVNGPCVIIASSPTCEFGRILHHLSHSVENPKDTVVFVGWVPPGTLGRKLQDGEKRVRIFDRWYDVRCQVRILHGLSAHADGPELIKFLKPTIRPETRFCVVHGEPPSAENFARMLLDAGAAQVEAPAMESALIQFTSQGQTLPAGKQATDGD